MFVRTHADKSRTADREWLPDMDLNHDKQIQSLLCYRYTIGQTNASKVGGPAPESRLTGINPLARLSANRGI